MRLTMLRTLGAVGLLLAAGMAAAQMPRVAWQHTTAPRGDGTRAYLQGQLQIPGPFPSLFAVHQPGFDPRAVVASNDGAYLIIPTNGGGSSENLAYLLTPFWLSNRGWQVMRVNASGQVLWSRFVTASITAYAPLPSEPQAYGAESSLLQAQLTTDGGLAMLTNGGLNVFDPQGTATFRGNLSTTACRPPVDDFSSPNVQMLTDEDVLLLGFGLFTSSHPRACAIDFNGGEIERVTSTAQAMEVADYRLASGFLVKEGSWSLGSWTSATLSLRNASDVRWSKPNMQNFFAEAYPQISPSGEVWVYLDQDLVKLDAVGNISWQRPMSELVGINHVAWLSGGGRLMANNDQDDDALLALRTDGSALWQRDLAGLTDPGVDANWQISSDRIRMAGYRESNDQGRVVSLTLSDGSVQADALITWGHDRPHTAFGLLGQNRVIDIAEGSGSFSRLREPNQPCDLDGYCPEAASFATPEVRTYTASDGVQSSTLSADSFGFPLSAFPLERRPAPRPIFGDDGGIGLLHTQYVHDGVRNNARIERLTRNGQVEWSRTLGFSEFDVGQVSVYHRPEAVYVSAAQIGPLRVATTPRVWKLSPDTGQIEWQRDLPFSVQQLRPMFAQVGGGINACSISTDWPHRIVCVSPTGEVSQVNIVGNPTDRRLISLGSRIVNNAWHLYVRAVPLNEEFTDRFEFATISNTGTYAAETVRQFEAVSGIQTLRTDAFNVLNNLATAAIYPNNSGFGRPQSMVVAKFDATGSRLWQHNMDGPFRAFVADGETTSVTESANGDVYVSVHPVGATNDVFPTRVCRLSSAGALLGCSESPRQGRVVNLFTLGAGDGVWAWLRGYIGENTGPVAMYLHRVDGQGFGPQELRIGSHHAFTSENFTFDEKFGYFMLSSNGTGSDRSADTKLVSIQFGQLPLFLNGFED